VTGLRPHEIQFAGMMGGRHSLDSCRRRSTSCGKARTRGRSTSRRRAASPWKSWR